MTVSELLEKLRYLTEQYHKNRRFPKLECALDLELFNTLRSYYFPWYYPVFSSLRKDERGELFEAVKSLGAGHVFISHTRPGVTRGDHFHLSKVERFLVLKGEAEIRIRRLFDEQVHRYAMDGRSPSYIDIPTLHTHNITNTGSDDLITLFWSHEIFNPEKPETYSEAV